MDDTFSRVSQSAGPAPRIPPPRPAPTRVRRLVWMAIGMVCVGLGGLGLALPGMPATVFFIGATIAFSKSSPRMEQWVLGLRGVGPLVRDYRAGLGMPRRAKVMALSMMTVAIAVSVAVMDLLPARIGVVALGVIGAVVIVRQPDRAPKPSATN